MKKVSKKSITQEYLFEAEDGTMFQYEGQAIEHDLKLLEEEMSPIKRGDINIPDLNLTGSIYRINNAEHFDLIKKYCDMKKYSLEDINIPANIIITDSFVLSASELKKVADEICNL